MKKLKEQMDKVYEDIKNGNTLPENLFVKHKTKGILNLQTMDLEELRQLNPSDLCTLTDFIGGDNE